MIHRRLRAFLCLSSLAITFAVQGTLAGYAGTLNGRVLDKTSGEILPGATIVVTPLDRAGDTKSVATGNDGTFEITDIPSGEYTATVSYIGFATGQVTNVTIPESNDPVQLDVTLVPLAINTGAITVTTSRRPEKVLEAPASVSVIEMEQVQARSTLSPAEHVKGLPAVDVASNGLQQANIAVRGFNKVFSGDLLVLTDNRIARVPSLRFNAYNMIPTVNDDIQQVEVVSGPGAALYGPNSASGVLHIVTRSPFSSPGTMISVGGGERDVFLGSFRHAGTTGDRLGYKITGQYQRGHDWESEDRQNEPDSIQFFRPGPTGAQVIGDRFENNRDFDIEKLAAEGRVDWVAGEDATVIVNGGLTRTSSIELTGIGAVQAIDWIYSYAQARFKYKDLFIQGFVNMSDAGDSYALRTGQLLVDKSKLWSGQIQHRYDPNDRLSFIYGLDALFTRPNTESTVNGRNEEKDNVDEFGVYLQSEAQISERVSLVVAARLDDHSALEDMVFSPRGGIVFRPDDHLTFRATYNRAYDTPDNNNLYLDILQNKDPFGVDTSFAPSLGFAPDIDIVAVGVPQTGFHWGIEENGVRFRSPFAPADPRQLTASDYINLNDPIFTNVMWGMGRGAVMSGFQAQLAANGVPQATIDALSASMNAVTPTLVQDVTNVMMTLDPNTKGFNPTAASDIADIDRLRPTITQTVEFGTKGVIGDRLRFSVDGYWTKKNDFIGPLTIETPNVFLDPASLSGYLGQEFGAALADPANADNAATLAMLDGAAMGGNENGSVVDELTAMFTSGAARIPFGTVTPEEALDPTSLLVTYRNFGDVSLYGTDLMLAYHLGRSWNAGGTYSYVSKNIFEKSADQVHDILLNAPRHKFGGYVQYANPQLGLNTQARIRFVDAFEMDSPYVGSTVQSYTVVDLNVVYEVFPGTKLALTVQNVLDNEHIEFIGAPKLGRLSMLRLTKSL